MKSSVLFKPNVFFALLLILQIILHLSVFSKDLVGFHVWRQTQTQNTIQSFVDEDINILNPRRNDRGSDDGVFRMEFPLSQWITAHAIKIFGNPVLLSRIMNFLFSFISVIGLSLWVGLYFKQTWIKLAAAILFSFSPVLFYYMVNPMPDNLALCFGVWGLYGFGLWKKTQHIKHLLLSLTFMALASLVKLPFVLYFSVFVWAILFSIKKDNFYQRFRTSVICLLFLIPVLSWYLWVIPDWEGNGIVKGVFNMSAEQKSQYWYYLWFHFRTSLPELLLGWPVVILFIFGMYTVIRKWRLIIQQYGYYALLAFMICAYLLFELNMIEKVHDYYLLPLLPLLVMLSIVGMKFMLKLNLMDALKKAILILIILSLPVYSYLRIHERWERIGFNQDLLTYKSELRSIIPAESLVCVGNDSSHHIFLYYVQKMGWAFENNWITADKLIEMISEGCTYLYCDSRIVDQKPEIRALFGTKVAEFGTIKVYKLVNQDGSQNR